MERKNSNTFANAATSAFKSYLDTNATAPIILRRHATLFWDDAEGYEADRSLEGLSRDAQYQLSRWLERTYSDHQPLIEDPYASLLHAAIMAVDWMEIADILLSEIDAAYRPRKVTV